MGLLLLDKAEREKEKEKKNQFLYKVSQNQ
jgi:hypothetical protein